LLRVLRSPGQRCWYRRRGYGLSVHFDLLPAFDSQIRNLTVKDREMTSSPRAVTVAVVLAIALIAAVIYNRHS
jgi:hypothetical protein